MGKRNRRAQQRRQNKLHAKTQWVNIIRKNDLFEQYYKIQKIVPDDEFPAFLEAIQKELPSTIRITGTRSHAKELSIAMQKLFLTKLDTEEDDEEKATDPPRPLSWYPDELAWQINLTKRYIRKSSCMDRFHKFLVHETETGNISRQEAVSMIPPLLLDVKPGQKILDACAAPGSKTVQLIELLHGEESSGIPDGLVVANELQNKRCYMLVHQSKRLHSPCCLITNHDAAMFPTMFVKGEGDEKVPLLFDRVLCDVPCSGDGTLRKNPLIWKKWTPQLGSSLFRIQLRILARAVEMLAVGGRIVYSTCTMNPIEDEAVICNLLQKAEGAMELVDVSSDLLQLKRSPGLKTWKVMTKGMKIVDNCDPGTEYYAKGFKAPMLPPSSDIANELHLERCMRVYPHQQDTGGFFIAVLEKKCEAPWENGNRGSTNHRLLPWETEADWQRKKQGIQLKKEEETKSTMVETVKHTNNIVEGKVETEGISNEKITIQADTSCIATQNMGCAEVASNCATSMDRVVVKLDPDHMNLDSDENTKHYGELNTSADVSGNNSCGENADEKEGDDNELAEDTDTMEKNSEDLAVNKEDLDDEDAEGIGNHSEETAVKMEYYDKLGDGMEDNSKENCGGKRECAEDCGNSGDANTSVEPPRKRVKKEVKGFKEDPFVFLKDDDEHWPSIKEFYGINDSFPVSQLFVRSVFGKKRNVYLVSKAVKDVMGMVDNNHKVINTGMKVIARAENDNVSCAFRLMQEGIEAMVPFISKRKVSITQEDVITLLTQDRPFCDQFSSTTREQFNKIEGQGCIVYLYDPSGPYSKAQDTIGCQLIFCGWKAKVSTRLQISKFDKAHYQVLCGIPPSDDSIKGSEGCEVEEADQSTPKVEVKTEVKTEKEEEPSGFIGDILILEAPKGSLDVGFI
ncbi:RNA cytosine-C(5)-methyltransferase NSUN2-like isoform X1 [Montipora foliosa]|uniref:RNA cytosine-C(5)-methyltransferase NSUN2-like isoform X1 n=1 Tax=Montipora foliosa TaxID=591990 RepID=UPI0035F1EEAF